MDELTDETPPVRGGLTKQANIQIIKKGGVTLCSREENE